MEVRRDIQIKIYPGVYEPGEDTYLLLDTIEVSSGQKVLEVGTGTGIIALHCVEAGAHVIATDMTQAATQNAHINSQSNNLQLEVIRTDLTAGINDRFDLILFNPPYLTNEGTGILSREEQIQVAGGMSGAETSIRFLKHTKGLLTEDGVIYLLTSSESEKAVLEYAQTTYVVKRVSEIKMFFEKLAIYRMKIRNNTYQ